jgi:thiosulfate/3-mercaptopyruvate sulfurtransferase
VYGDSPTDAARAWWLLSYVGAPRVGLLDGGWAKWTAAKAPTSTDTPRIELARFEVKFQAERVIEEEALRQALTGNQAKIVDARTAGEFTDRGHLPGAVRLEWSELMADDGTYKTSDEIREMFAKLGLTNEAEIVTHCQTGARSSVEVFALELAGFGKVKNYYCGWSEWGADAQNPVEK